MFCYELGGPSYSFTVHGTGELDFAPMLALREKIDRAEFVVTVSQFSKSQLFRHCNYEQWNKIHVIHCGLDDQFLHQPLIPVDHQKHFVCVGRLSQEKGQLLLIEAAAKLAQEKNDFTLDLIGDGDLRPQLQQLINEYGLQEQVRITGWGHQAKA